MVVALQVKMVRRQMQAVGLRRACDDFQTFNCGSILKSDGRFRVNIMA